MIFTPTYLLLFIFSINNILFLYKENYGIQKSRNPVTVIAFCHGMQRVTIKRYSLKNTVVSYKDLSTIPTVSHVINGLRIKLIVF